MTAPAMTLVAGSSHRSPGIPCARISAGMICINPWAPCGEVMLGSPLDSTRMMPAIRLIGVPVCSDAAVISGSHWSTGSSRRGGPASSVVSNARLPRTSSPAPAPG
jgi:hypothetical protein